MNALLCGCGGGRRQGLAFFNHIHTHKLSRHCALVHRVVDNTSGYHKGITGSDFAGRLASDEQHGFAFHYVADFIARMGMPSGCCTRCYLDARHHCFAVRNGYIGFGDHHAGQARGLRKTQPREHGETETNGGKTEMVLYGWPFKKWMVVVVDSLRWQCAARTPDDQCVLVPIGVAQVRAQRPCKPIRTRLSIVKSYSIDSCIAIFHGGYRQTSHLRLVKNVLKPKKELQPLNSRFSTGEVAQSE